eukprot:scaffold21263_cov141-Isochrysis_galbana.AAC.1
MTRKRKNGAARGDVRVSRGLLPPSPPLAAAQAHHSPTHLHTHPAPIALLEPHATPSAPHSSRPKPLSLSPFSPYPPPQPPFPGSVALVVACRLGGVPARKPWVRGAVGGGGRGRGGRRQADGGRRWRGGER